MDKLNVEQQEFYDAYINTHYNLLCIGCSNTGKSILHYMILELTNAVKDRESINLVSIDISREQRIWKTISGTVIVRAVGDTITEEESYSIRNLIQSTRKSIFIIDHTECMSKRVFERMLALIDAVHTGSPGSYKPRIVMFALKELIQKDFPLCRSDFWDELDLYVVELITTY